MTQPLFNPNDSLTGRDGGPYLDEEEARVAEERRAVIEKREPEEKPAATAGIPLVTASELAVTATINNIPSQGVSSGPLDLMVQGAVDDKDVLLEARGERDLDALQATEDEGNTVDPTEVGGESLSNLGKEETLPKTTGTRATPSTVKKTEVK